MIDVTISLNPIWQRFSVVNFFGSFSAVARLADWLKIPNKTCTTLANWFYVVYGKLIEWELLIARKAMKVIEFTKAEPFDCGVRATRLGFVSATQVFLFLICKPSFFGLLISQAGFLFLLGTVVATRRYFTCRAVFPPFLTSFIRLCLLIPLISSPAAFLPFLGLQITLLGILKGFCFRVGSIPLFAALGLTITYLILLSLLGAPVFAFTGLSFIRLSVLLLAIPTPSLKAVFIRLFRVKLRKQLGLFASTTFLFVHLASFEQIKALYLSSCWTPIAAVTLQIKGLISYYNYLIRFSKVTSKRLASCNNYITKVVTL